MCMCVLVFFGHRSVTAFSIAMASYCSKAHVHETTLGNSEANQAVTMIATQVCATRHHYSVGGKSVVVNYY